MKKILLIGLATIATCGVARAQYSLSLDLTYASDYVFRGVMLSENTLHPSVEYGYDAFYAGIWAATPINNRPSAGYIDEYDFYAGYGWELSDTVQLDAGVTHYYYPESSSTTEAYVGLNFDLEGVTPGVYIYRDLDLDTWTYQANIGYSVPVEGSGSSLDLSAFYGRVDPDSGSSYTYYGASGVMPFALNENTTLSVGLHYAHNNIGFGIDSSNVFGTVGVTMGF